MYLIVVSAPDFQGQPGLEFSKRKTRTRLAAVTNRLFVFATTTDGRIVLSQAVLGQGFSGWTEVQGGLHSNISPASASIGSRVYVSAIATGGGFVTNQADLGHPFGMWF
jgi:hypothetical protein